MLIGNHLGCWYGGMYVYTMRIKKHLVSIKNDDDLKPYAVHNAHERES